MKMWASAIAAWCVAGAVVTLLLMQRATLTDLRSEVAGQEQPEDPQSPSSSVTRTSEAPTDSSRPDLEQLAEETRDLHKLRAEVTELRRTQTEIQQLQAENEKLRSALTWASRRPGKSPGTPAEAVLWEEKGFASPAATIETFFWAATRGDRDKLLDCTTPELRPEFQRELERLAEHGQSLLAFAQFSRFTIVDTQTVSPDELILTLQIESQRGPAKSQMALRRTPAGWKLTTPVKP
jgi:glycine/D-amino acid oxidase-like deaminating enzyme